MLRWLIKTIIKSKSKGKVNAYYEWKNSDYQINPPQKSKNEYWLTTFSNKKGLNFF